MINEMETFSVSEESFRKEFAKKIIEGISYDEIIKIAEVLKNKLTGICGFDAKCIPTSRNMEIPYYTCKECLIKLNDEIRKYLSSEELEGILTKSFTGNEMGKTFKYLIELNIFLSFEDTTFVTVEIFENFIRKLDQLLEDFKTSKKGKSK